MSKKTATLPAFEAAPFDPGKPYNGLPLLPPASEIETRAVLKKSGRAASSLAALQQAAELIPNQEVLINSIPLREAKDSSAIENIVTTSDKLFRFANVDERLLAYDTPATAAVLRG
jgi:Fic family protein